MYIRPTEGQSPRKIRELGQDFPRPSLDWKLHIGTPLKQRFVQFSSNRKGRGKFQMKFENKKKQRKEMKHESGKTHKALRIDKYCHQVLRYLPSHYLLKCLGAF